VRPIYFPSHLFSSPSGEIWRCTRSCRGFPRGMAGFPTDFIKPWSFSFSQPIRLFEFFSALWLFRLPGELSSVPPSFLHAVPTSRLFPVHKKRTPPRGTALWIFQSFRVHSFASRPDEAPGVQLPLITPFRPPPGLLLSRVQRRCFFFRFRRLSRPTPSVLRR